MIKTNIARDKVQYGRHCIAVRVHGPGSVMNKTGSWPMRRTGCCRKLSTAWVDALFSSFRERTYSPLHHLLPLLYDSGSITLGSQCELWKVFEGFFFF